MNMRKPYILIPFIVLLLGINVWTAYLILRPPSEKLEVHFLDVGQGDAILIETPDGVDILIDGGPDRSVLRQLPKKLGVFDKKIDVVVASHPDKDHIAGLVDTIDRYDVSYFIEPGVEHDSSFADGLQEVVKREEGITHVIARRGMRIRLGSEVYADVLFPDRDVTHGETNDSSVALRLVYRDTSFMFAGDLSSGIEDYIVLLDPSSVKSTVLKASHHGSKTSTSDVWLRAVNPEIVVISAGKDNSYGHPASEVVERITEMHIPMLSTMNGTVTLVSDGGRVWVH